jgi:FtsH-binding integral membrane protein
MTDRHVHQQLGGSLTAAEVAIVDQGLHTYMLRVYAYMALGLAATGLAALLTDQLAAMIEDGLAAGRLTHGLMLASIDRSASTNELKWLLILAPLGLVLLVGFRIERMSQTAAEAVFLGCAVVAGASFEVLFLVFVDSSGAPVFFAGAAAFSALVLCGHLSRHALSWQASFAIMFLGGTPIACLPAAAVPGSIDRPVASIAGVALLAGLTMLAGDRLKSEYVQGVACGGMTERPAVKGALALFLAVTNVRLLLPGRGRRHRGAIDSHRVDRAAPHGS